MIFQVLIRGHDCRWSAGGEDRIDMFQKIDLRAAGDIENDALFERFKLERAAAAKCRR